MSNNVNFLKYTCYFSIKYLSNYPHKIGLDLFSDIIYLKKKFKVGVQGIEAMTQWLVAHMLTTLLIILTYLLTLWHNSP